MTLKMRMKIEQRAHQMWLDEGCPDNRAMDHWLQAEKEVCTSQGKKKGRTSAKEAA